MGYNGMTDLLLSNFFFFVIFISVCSLAIPRSPPSLQDMASCSSEIDWRGRYAFFFWGGGSVNRVQMFCAKLWENIVLFQRSHAPRCGGAFMWSPRCETGRQLCCYISEQQVCYIKHFWKTFPKKCKCDCVLRVVPRAPVAVGTAAVSTEQMHCLGMKGRGVCILHTYMDYLWWVAFTLKHWIVLNLSLVALLISVVSLH